MKTDTGACAGTPELNESFQGLTARACPESDAVRRTAPAAEHPEKVKELFKLIGEQIAAGRSTPGPRVTNDREGIDLFRGIPRFVWRKQP